MTERLDQALSELGRDGIVQPGDEDLILRAADAALARSGARAIGPQPKMWVTSRLVQVAAAAVLMLTAGASAAWWVTNVMREPSPEPTTAKPAQRHVRAPVVTEEPVPVIITEPAPMTDAPLEATSLRDEVLTNPRDLKRAPTQDAASLFHAANVARGAGETTRAKKLYAQLIARHPDSEEAHVAHVALGKLWLATGRASAAEREFRQYLDAGGGPLSEEALFSRAQALQRLDRSVEERAAWTKLLSTYPQSVYANHARERLQER